LEIVTSHQKNPKRSIDYVYAVVFNNRI
jgi:hypothetical protein